MKNRIQLFIVFALISSILAYAKAPNLNEVEWQRGPSTGDLDGIAQIRIPAGYVFANGDDTRLIMEMMQNPTSGEEVGFAAPTEGKWYIVFEFEKVGYIRDDEKNSLDADAMLKSIKESTEASNKERKKRGWPTMKILGWEQKPQYNDKTHNLEWAVRGEGEGQAVINYNTRLLGRSGVMRVTLVVEPAKLSQTLPKFRDVLSGYEFKKGQKYAEFRQGDKIAKYGLTALVVGGASAVAVKTGLFKWIWKLLVVGFLAVVGFFKKLFSRKRTQ